MTWLWSGDVLEPPTKWEKKQAKVLLFTSGLNGVLIEDF